MLRVQRILFATDLSESSDRAFVYAAYLAHRYGASLHFLNVVASQGAGDGERLEGIVWTPEEMAEVLAATPAVGNPSDGTLLLRDLDVEQVQLLHPAPARAVVAYAEEHEADLVVLGVHGGGAMQRIFPGRIAEEVVRHAPCPILTVPGDRKHDLVLAPERILVAVDLTPHSRAALAHAAALAEEHDARVDVLHVMGGEDAAAVSEGGRTQAVAEATETLRRLLEELGGLLGVEPHVTEGDPAPTITAHAERLEADLLVLATHGHTGLQRTVMGSVAEDVVRIAPSPVLTVRTSGRGLLP